MTKEYRSIIGTPVLHFDDGSLVAIIRDIIVDPDTGKVEAFWVKPMGLPLRHAVLQSQDIVEWKKNVYVKDESAIAEAGDIIRIADILSRKTYVIGNRVTGQSGARYGRVYSADFDTESFYLKNIYAQKSLFGLFPQKKRVFSFDSIIEILPNVVLINDDAAKKEKVIEPNLVEDRPASA